MGFLNPAAAMVEGSREHVSAGGGGLPPLWRVRLDITPLGRAAYGDGATVKAAKQEAARALLRQLDGLPPAAGAAAARAGIIPGAGAPGPVTMMLQQPAKPSGSAAAAPLPPSYTVSGVAGYVPLSSAGSLASAGGSSGDSRPTTGLIPSEGLSSGPFRHGLGLSPEAPAWQQSAAASGGAGAGDAGSAASAADSRGGSASLGGYGMHAAPLLLPTGAAAAALAAAAHVGDAMCRLNTRLQLMGYQNPAAVLREVSRTHVSDIPEVWRVEMAVVPLGISRVGEASTVKEARKAAAAQLLTHLGEPAPFHERESRAAGGRGITARELARAEIGSAAATGYDPYYMYSPGMGGGGTFAAAAGAPGAEAYPSYEYGSAEDSHVYPPLPQQQYDYHAAAEAADAHAAAAAAAGSFQVSAAAHEAAPPPPPPPPPPSAYGAENSSVAGSAAASETGEPAAHEMHISPEPADTPASASSGASSGGGMGSAAASSGAASAAAGQPKPSPGGGVSSAGAGMHSWQASDDPAAFAPEERSPAAVRVGGRATHSGGGGSGDSRDGDDAGPEHGDSSSAAAAGAGGPPGGGLLLLAAVAAAASAKSAPPPAAGAGSRTASAAPAPLPLSSAQLHEFAELVRTLTSLPAAELAWEARLGEALLSLSISFATSPHAPTNAIPSAAVREARLLSRLRALWEQLEAADRELALASSLPDDDPSCASVMRALLWRVFGNAGALGPLQQLAPSLFAFVGLPAPAAPR